MDDAVGAEYVHCCNSRLSCACGQLGASSHELQRVGRHGRVGSDGGNVLAISERRGDHCARYNVVLEEVGKDGLPRDTVFGVELLARG